MQTIPLLLTEMLIYGTHPIGVINTFLGVRKTTGFFSFMCVFPQIFNISN